MPQRRAKLIGLPETPALQKSTCSRYQEMEPTLQYRLLKHQYVNMHCSLNTSFSTLSTNRETNLHTLQKLEFHSWNRVLRQGKLIQFHSGLVRGEDNWAKAALISHISVTISCISALTKAKHFPLLHVNTLMYCTHTPHVYILFPFSQTDTPLFQDSLTAWAQQRLSEKWHVWVWSLCRTCMRVACTVSCLMSALMYLCMTGQRCVS